MVDEYEKKTINGVRINAILADSQQHLPLQVQKMLSGQNTISNAARMREKEEVIAISVFIIGYILIHYYFRYWQAYHPLPLNCLPTVNNLLLTCLDKYVSFLLSFLKPFLTIF